MIKVLSNPRDLDLSAYFDVYAGAVLEGNETLDRVGSAIWDRVMETVLGRPTYLERCPAPAHQVWELLVRGPTV